MKKRVAFITGSGHSGSTLLALVLGSHKRTFGLGEISSLYKICSTDSPKICGICETECPFWNVRADRRVLINYFSSKNLFSKLKSSLLHYQKSFYSYLFDWAQSEVLIDASKNIRWVRRQVNVGHHWKSVIPLIVFLHRDGRAVINSYLRKFPEKTIEQAVFDWKRNLEEIDHFYRNSPPEQRISISYEKLAVEPYDEIRRLCDFLQIEFQPEMLNYWGFDHHIVGGNFGTRSLIFRYRNEADIKNGEVWTKKLEKLADRRKGYYEKMGLGIKLDSRWKQELSSSDLEVFEAIGGDLNRRLMEVR